jgi:hypothetical protein
MKNKFAQVAYFITKLDPHYVRFAYFVLALGVGVIMKCPVGGGTDPV